MKNTSVKIRALSLSIMLLVLATSSVQAVINYVATTANSTQNSEYSDFVAQYADALDDELNREFSLPELSIEESRLAESILNRTYNLYPEAFYKFGFDQDVTRSIKNYDTYSQALNSNDISEEEKIFAQCQTYSNQPLRYRSFAKYFAYEYVDSATLEEVQSSLKMLNHFFIDDLAMAAQNGDINDLDSEFYYKLKQQGLEEAYEEFLNSVDYKEIKELTNLQVGKRSGEPLIPLFIYANYMTCGYLTRGIMHQNNN